MEMMLTRYWNPILTKPLAAIFGALMLGLLFTLAFPESASAHGYVESPASRSYLCGQGQNKNCGPVQYEPQSVEGIGNFPQSGPADGHIAGGGVFPDLDAQAADRWKKVTLNGGPNSFTWKLTAPHSTKEWKYYITKKDWNPNKPLARADLEPTPFCYVYDGGKRPGNSVIHQCNVPTDRSGYHLILAVWEIADTGNAFYQVLDVNLVNNGSGTEAPSVPSNLISKNVNKTSIEIGWIPSASAIGIKEYEIYRNNSLVGKTSKPSYVDSGLTPNMSYMYTIRAVDTADNKSAPSSPLSVKTLPDNGSAYPVWDPDKVYNGGDRVQYNGGNYEARWWTQGEKPGTSEVWKVIS
jgi:predicted carbohydrate-binding protein with CBM5 and CBM33 domain